MFQKIWEKNYQENLGINRYPWDYVVSFIFNHFPRHKPKRDIRILELGFGSGCNLWCCAREGFDCYGIEGSQTAYEYASNWFNEEGLSVTIKQGHFHPLPYNDNMFDIIIDRASLTCLTTHSCTQTMQEASRVLSTDGLFLFTPYSKEHDSYKTGTISSDGLVQITAGSLSNVGDLNFYNLADIQKLTENTQLQIIDCQHWQKKEIITNSNHSEWHVTFKKTSKKLV